MASSSSYAVRAAAIHDLAVGLRRRLELASVGSVADKMSVIDLGVEVVNKILYCFLVSQEMFDTIETELNCYYRSMKPLSRCVDRVFNALLSVVRKFELTASEWVAKYAK